MGKKMNRPINAADHEPRASPPPMKRNGLTA